MTRRRAGALLAVFVTVVGLLAMLAVAMLTLNSGVRAYVNGESLYSKAQKDAVFHLRNYLDSGAPADYLRFRERLSVPLGDREARIALDRDPPDLEAARRALLQGGNHPADIDKMIFIYRRLSWLPEFGDAVSIWARADAHLVELLEVGRQAKSLIEDDRRSPAAIERIRDRLLSTNQALGRLETRFSEVMGQAARRANRLLLTVFALIALLLLTAGGLLLRRISAEAFAQEARFRTTFEEAGVGIGHFDLNGRCTNANGALQRMLSGTGGDVVGICLETIDADSSDPGLRESVEPLVADHTDSIRIERRLRRLDGSTFWVNANVTLMRDMRNRPLHFIFIVEDITERKRLADELAYQARHDAVTGLINRREFERILGQAVDRSRQRHVRNALIYIDLDQFKHVNDSAGHSAGDAMLEQLGPLIRSVLRSSDTIARIGGDEFAVLLHGCPADKALDLAVKLRKNIGDYRFAWEEREFQISASLGVVPFGEHVDEQETGLLDPGRLLSLADAACYEAKEKGRDRVYMIGYEDPLPKRFSEEVEAVDRVRGAIDEGRFELEFQPIVPLAVDADGTPSFYESLVRLVAPDGSLKAPATFIPSAERFGLVPHIDLWVLQKVISELQNRPDEDSLLSVNVSAVSINSEDFRNWAADMVGREGVPSHRICFEITETSAISNLDSALAFLQRMRAFDCRFALDDFGSGFSSFAYLHRLPVDYLKIDGEFIRALDAESPNEAIVRSIRDVARSMGMRTIAEFVETDEVRQHLAEIGIDFGQGFGIARPGPLPSSRRSRPR